MMRFTQGNLLEADVDAVVNTVNTVGVMGKGIALMFKERFPENFQAYAAACKRGDVEVGRMFLAAASELHGPRWIINFPTKKHWRSRTQLPWVIEGLEHLRGVIQEKGIRSIAIPPLGCGNGGLEWRVVRPLIENALSGLGEVEVIVYEPTAAYQGASKRKGVEELTPARALIAEMVRCYSVLGIECSILEIQKLAWFLDRVIQRNRLPNPLRLEFTADQYGPYAYRLTHLLDALDGSYLRCDKRLADASPFDTIQFVEEKRDKLAGYLSGPEGTPFANTLEETDRLIDGFQSPLGMEALATVDWLLSREHAPATVEGIRQKLDHWEGGKPAAQRKQRQFSDRLVQAAIERLQPTNENTSTSPGPNRSAGPEGPSA